MPTPDSYVVVPWDEMPGAELSDGERLTYELILSLAWAHDRQGTAPITRRELARLRGVAVRTIDAHLRALRDGGWVSGGVSVGSAGLILFPRHAQAEATTPRRAAMNASAAPDASPRRARAGRLPHTTELQREAASREERSPPLLHRHAGRARRSHETAAPTASSYSPLATAKAERSDTTADDVKPPLPSAGALLEEVEERGDEGRENELYLALTRAGVYPGAARRILHLPWVTRDLICAWDAHLRRNPRVRAPAAVLATVLSHPDRCLPGPPTTHAEGVGPGAPSPGTAIEGQEGDGRGPASDGAPGDALCDIERADSAEAEEIEPPCAHIPWSEALASLRETLGDETVDTWLRYSVPISCEGSRLVVAVRSPYAADWLAEHCASQACAAMRQVTGEAWDVRFIVARLDMLGDD